MIISAIPLEILQPRFGPQRGTAVHATPDEVRIQTHEGTHILWQLPWGQPYLIQVTEEEPAVEIYP